ncbi:uncharacterized protein LOC109708742 [Ananas comosus]|uniref:UPF0481 protein n=1 Tax=Ananas comosus TaxID=4615 RepID=A0A199VZ92_ANACO|nr:uncharacterized protein LOC109708742 [Ananas comosus]OAY81990.1 UPF0481 protein [Ananas comosus]
MEDHTKKAAVAFMKPNARAFFNKVVEIVGECRDCYNGGSLPLMSKDEFTRMLFIDGCFILQFIDQAVKNDMKDFTVSAHLQGFILRDMFLRENQLPYCLLEKLMEAKSVDIDKFVDQVADTQGQWQKMEKENSSKSIDGEHEHLLARLRMRQLGPGDQTPQLAWGSNWQSFRSAKGLIESGIKLRWEKTSFLHDVKFTPCLVWGKLSLPRIVIDDLTRSRLLNMIALEMCSTAGGDYGITSLVWFLDLLIDHADDVKELRQAGVLLNALGSDEQVVEMFDEIATDLVPDQQAYSTVTQSINSYYTFKARVSIYRMLHRRFGQSLVGHRLPRGGRASGAQRGADRLYCDTNCMCLFVPSSSVLFV